MENRNENYIVRCKCTKMCLAVCNENGEVLIVYPDLTEAPEITMPKMIAYFKEQQVEALGIDFWSGYFKRAVSQSMAERYNTPKLAWKWYPVLDEFNVLRNYMQP